MSTYEWNTGETTPQISINQDGLYWLRVGNGCYFWTDSITVVPDSALPIDFGPDTLLCQGESLTLDAGAPVYWSNGGYGTSLQIGASGTYRCWFTNTCGTYGDTIRVDYVAPLEELRLSGDACRDSVVYVKIPAEGDSLVWFDGLNSYERGFSTPGVYSFTRFNACGGSPGAFEATFVDCECRLFVPESFSPNSDGVNEFFNIGHSCTLKEFEFLIFDRLGGLLYRTNNPDFKWNGEIDGQVVPLGLYHWVANYRYSRNGIDPSFRSERGSLILIR
jgi:gliding motility-associated-like protein